MEEGGGGLEWGEGGGGGSGDPFQGRKRRNVIGFQTKFNSFFRQKIFELFVQDSTVYRDT